MSINMRDKYLLRDDDEGFYDVILFNEKIDVEKLEEFIKKYKNNNQGEWNLDKISAAIKNNFSVKEVLMFDYLNGNTGDIANDDIFKIEENINLVKFENITILRGNLSEKERISETNKLLDFFKKNDMEITNFKDLGKRKLAYPIGKIEEGHYLNVYFVADSRKILPFETFLREDENVLKYITLKTEYLENSENEAEDSEER